jgi:hypothetical protein
VEKGDVMGEAAEKTFSMKKANVRILILCKKVVFCCYSCPSLFSDVFCSFDVD